ncbi:MAG: EamA family transporter [Acidimicrobiia bacterium]
MIYGLIAAVGWGLADFFGAVAGRRTGSLPAVIVGQAFSALFITAVVVVTDRSLVPLAAVIGFVVLNGIASATAYGTHYRGLELGPVAVVSPIGASYAVVGVLLAIVFLGERPSGLALAGMAVTVVGVALVSTDLPSFFAKIHDPAPGLKWAVASGITFGVAGFLLGFLVRETDDWAVAMFGSRWAMLLAFLPIALPRRKEFDRMWAAGLVGLGLAVVSGAADTLGVVSYSYGAERDSVAIILATSAVFPLIAVAASHLWLHERLVANQYAGIGLVVVGLVLLGLGS